MTVNRQFLVFIAATGLAAACAPTDEDEETAADLYDATTQNFVVKGTISGKTLDISVVADESLVAEREYKGPPLTGTNPADEIPDIPQSALCSVEAGVVASFDGFSWEVEFELENFIASEFAEGTLQVIGPDDPAAAGKAAVEIQLTRSDDQEEIERTAISGTVEIEELSHESTHPENADIHQGGTLGVYFDLAFGPDENLKGALHVDFGDNSIDGEEC